MKKNAEAGGDLKKVTKKIGKIAEVKIEIKDEKKDGTVSGAKISTDSEKLKKVKSETKNSVTSSSSGVIDFTDDNDYNFENGENDNNGNLKIMTGSESKTDSEIKTEQETTTTTIKPKYKSLTLLEDPMQFHAKPRQKIKLTSAVLFSNKLDNLTSNGSAEKLTLEKI